VLSKVSRAIIKQRYNGQMRLQVIPSTRAITAAANGVAAAENEASAILSQAETLRDFDFGLVADRYQASLATIVEEKIEQVERLETRLENLLEDQTTKLADIRSHQPGLLSGARARTQWSAQVAEAEAALQRIHSRLDKVREIRDEVTVHGRTVEVLAERQLAHRDPTLANEFAEMEQARRLHEAHFREQARKRSQEIEPKRGAGRGLGLAAGQGV
jgi:hypothetical protein